MLISHMWSFVFVKTRKTAGTSIEIALSRHMGPDDVITLITPEDEVTRQAMGGRGPQNTIPWPTRWSPRDVARLALRRRPPRFYNHMPARTIRKYLGTAKWDRYLTFTVERNPWDLAVSAWWWQHTQFGRDRPFTEFVYSDDLSTYSNWRMYTVDGQVLIDKVLRYDELTGALQELTNSIGLPVLELPHAKSRHRTDRRPYQEWYDDASRDRVADIFHREIDYFGWDF